MAAISATSIRDLRESTGAGILDCKKALDETQGDMEKAVAYLREKGVVKAAKKANRAAAEGLVRMCLTADCAALAEVNCETDFVARNDRFQKLASDVAELVASSDLASNSVVDAETIGQWTFGSSGNSVAGTIQQIVAEIGENILARRAVKLSEGNVFGGYIHSNGSIGVVVSLATSAATDTDLTGLAKDIAMHIAAAAPISLSRDEVPAATVNAEKDIFMSQLLTEGKTAAMAEKIVVGKLNKYFAEQCLLEQGFVKDPDITITQLLTNKGKEAGCTINITGFSRFKVGEGVEKNQTNFAEEVASMVK